MVSVPWHVFFLNCVHSETDCQRPLESFKANSFVTRVIYIYSGFGLS